MLYMSKTDTKTFRIVTPEGDIIAPGVLRRSIQPMVGERVTVLNYPDILNFVIDRFDDDLGTGANSSLEPMTIVLRRDSRVKTRPVARRSQLSMAHVASRLKAMLPEALLTMPERTHLRLSESDFAALCDGEGIDASDRDTFDAVAYEDIPLTVMADGEGRSQFEGFSRVDGALGDFTVLYVSRRDGTPFGTDAVILQIAELYFAETLSRKTATASLFDHIVRLDTSVHGPKVLNGITEYLALIEMNIMSPRLAAQELTDLMLNVWQLES